MSTQDRGKWIEAINVGENALERWTNHDAEETHLINLE